MGTHCAPLLADIFLFSYEAEFIHSLLSAGKKQLASHFNFTYRYIDDVLSINNPDFENYLAQMYSAELEIKDTKKIITSASYLDPLLSIESDGQLRTPLYDKHDDFNFHIINFPFLSSNITYSPTYGVFFSQIIRYVRAWSSDECIILRAARLSYKSRDISGNVWNRPSGSSMVDTGTSSNIMNSPSLKCYIFYLNIFYFNQFFPEMGLGISFTTLYVSSSYMVRNMLGHDHIQWLPPMIRHFTKSWPCYQIWPFNRFWRYYLIPGNFYRTFATGAASQQRTLTSPDTWSCPIWDLHLFNC